MLKINETDTKKVYFTSDWHWNHDPKWPVPIWKMRGHSSKEEHNETIIDTTNSIVRENDVLVNVGDITLNCKEEEFENLISRIKCKNIYLLWGNHNSPCKTIYQREVKSLNVGDVEIYPLKYKNIIFVGHYLELTVDGQYIVVNHYPLMSWNHMQHNSIHLHGHEHGGLNTSLPSCKNGKILDVGIDIFPQLLSFSDMMNIMRTKQTVSLGHH